MMKNWFRRRPPARLQVLMVCMGNICRSPIAEAVLRSKLDQAGLAADVVVDSAGTHGFHRGSAPDPRGVAQAALRGYQVAGLKSRPVEAADFERFDLVLAMDRSNLATLQERCPPAQHHRLHLLLPFAGAAGAVLPVLRAPLALPAQAQPRPPMKCPTRISAAWADLRLCSTWLSRLATAWCKPCAAGWPSPPEAQCPCCCGACTPRQIDRLGYT